MLGSIMNPPTTAAGRTAGETDADWQQLAERIETARALLSSDPLMALSQLVEAEAALSDRVMEHAVRAARAAGATWAEIAVATGVKDRQAAWRRWTDRGIR
jgi:sugar phosphate isomerase/epimerase